jgi:para-aminobenzoate synthetase component I
MYSTEIRYTDLHIRHEEFRLKALAWAEQFTFAAYYHHNSITYPYQGFDHLLAVSDKSQLSINQEEAFADLRKMIKRNNPLFGYLTYDLKNQIEKLGSNNSDNINFPPIFFFSPEAYLSFKIDKVTIYSISDNGNSILKSILSMVTPKAEKPLNLEIDQRVTPERYKENVHKIKHHILEGDVYEMNYCIEFYSQQADINPLPLYLALNNASPTPFSGFLKHDDKFLLCASPERYLKKEGTKLISQPIKGTIKRGKTPEEDLALQLQLRNDEKELAENMMIVDLVRNDLSRSCSTGTVQVEEMFGIYGFRQVSQMISTITGELAPGKDIVDALIGTFPMGSMTGAPKISAMNLIEELENTKRGLYSGAFGYIKDSANADFNVVIRSIQYNASAKYLSFMVGSAITYDSDPDREYEECLLKAEAILKILNAKI